MGPRAETHTRASRLRLKFGNKDGSSTDVTPQLIIPPAHHVLDQSPESAPSNTSSPCFFHNATGSDENASPFASITANASAPSSPIVEASSGSLNLSSGDFSSSSTSSSSDEDSGLEETTSIPSNSATSSLSLEATPTQISSEISPVQLSSEASTIPPSPETSPTPPSSETSTTPPSPENSSTRPLSSETSSCQSPISSSPIFESTDFERIQKPRAEQEENEEQVSLIPPEQLGPESKFLQIGKYILSPESQCTDVEVYQAFHCDSHQEYVCKATSVSKYRSMFSPYFIAGHHEHINEIEEIILTEKRAYVIFPRHYGDLHSYVRSRKRLREPIAGMLFKQIIKAVAHCHKAGLVLRDLKLRKFVFKNPEKTELMLESLEDAFVVGEDNDDSLQDKHGCPAYVSPEILIAQMCYSGRGADLWSAGVMLYTLLVGRYPFHDVQPNHLFKKIRRGDYHIPDSVSSRAKGLIRALLRKHPEQRLKPEEILQHPWFQYGSKIYSLSSCNRSSSLSSSSHNNPSRHNDNNNNNANNNNSTKSNSKTSDKGNFYDQKVPVYVEPMDVSSWDDPLDVLLL